MESIPIYEQSYSELNKIKKQLSIGSQVTIDFDKLDSESKDVILSSLKNNVFERSNKVNAVIRDIRA